MTGIFHTELSRLLVTNSSEQSYAKHVLLFMKKLRKKGHNMKKFSEVLKQYPYSRRSLVMQNRKRRQSASSFRPGDLGATARDANFGYTLKFVVGLDRLHWSKVNSAARFTLQKLVKKRLKIQQRYTVGKNLFRILYRHTW